MSNYVCKECGAHHYDLGRLGYRTHDDVELMEDYRKLSKTMIDEREKHIEDCLMCDKLDLHKEIDELKELLRECYQVIMTGWNCNQDDPLLTKIQSAIGESEE